ncbi:hypothetical protein L249_7049, partial [Ophiocordyceps polyrhachis-furcata BCC 54312]
LPEPESLAKEYFWSLPIVAERGNFFKKRRKVKRKAVKKEVEMDEELTNREGNYVIEKKKRNYKVRKANANDSSKRSVIWRKTCTYQSDRSDRSDPITPAITAITRPLWPL